MRTSTSMYKILEISYFDAIKIKFANLDMSAIPLASYIKIEIF